MKCALIVMLLAMELNVQAATAKFKVIVTDRASGTPVQGAKVAGWFHNAAKGWMSSGETNLEFGYTDSKGCCCLSGKTDNGDVSVGVWAADGYYAIESIPNCVPRGNIKIPFERVSYIGRWLPDDIVVTARLDRIMNPVPLFVKKSTGKFREKKQWYYFQDADYKEISKLSATNDVPIIKGVVMSYDFFKGAYLPPYGDGEKADVSFIFNETCYGWEVVRGGPGVSAYKRFRMDVSVVFPGMGNGMVEVPHVLNAGINLRTATQDGYGNKMTCWYGRFFGERGEKTNCNKSRCYAFRIRTVYDEGGNIKSAYYGKIYGDFDMTGLDGVRFLYYLNPTPNDRNLEWDMKNNLCPNPGDIGNPRP